MEMWTFLVGFVRFMAIMAITLTPVTPRYTDTPDDCPDDADECLREAGLGPAVNDPSKLCTYLPEQLDKAGLCLSYCGYPAPQSLSEISRNLETVCSAQTGCESFLSKYSLFKTCYNSTNNLKSLIESIVTKHNSKFLSLDDCLKIREVRSCMKRLSDGCSYLGNIYTNLLSLDNFDFALSNCGAEDVFSPFYDDGCQDVENNIERNCNIACDLTKAQTAGDICSLLQQQSDCLYRNSERCTDAQITYLLPRIHTYSIINQLFMCNITVNGVVALPAFGLDCDFRRLLQECFNIQTSDGISLLVVKKLLNGDLPVQDFCSLYGDKEDLITNCAKSYWPCLIPLTQVYKTRSNNKDLDLSLGVFPIGELGLKLIFDRCTGNNPILSCTSPGYDQPRITPRRAPRVTPGVKPNTPHG